MNNQRGACPRIPQGLRIPIKRFLPQIKSVVKVISALLLAWCLSGCVMISRTPVVNRALWRAKLPKAEAFEGALLVLKEPPAMEFALLLAERYPKSYVLMMPRQFKNDWKWPYMSGETETYFNGRLDPVVTLDKYLIFHDLHMTATDALPESVSGAPMVHLSWEAEKTSETLARFQKGLAFAHILPTFITLGSIWPPPMPTSAYMPVLERPDAQLLSVALESGERRDYEARRYAESELVYGMLWRLPMMFLCWDNPRTPYFQGSTRFGNSPGGWSDCLGQMFRDDELLSYLRSCTPEGVIAREKWFDTVADESLFCMVRLPEADGDWTTIRSAYGFRDAMSRETPMLYWNGLKGERNGLVHKWVPGSKK